MTPRQLNYFLRIAELRSFTKAAAVLRIAQPALSRQIQQLEEDLGLRLLVRSESGVSLTEAGSALQSKATGLLQHFAKVRDEVGAFSDSVQGRMHFGMPPSLSDLVTTPLLIALLHQHPAVRPSLIEGISSAVFELVLAGRLDFGIVLSTESMLGLHGQRLFREQLFFASAPTRSHITGATISLAEVAGQPLILTQPPNAMRAVLDKAMGQQDLTTEILLETNSSRTQTELVARGIGYDKALSLPHRPYHTHDEIHALTPGEPVELDIEIWPTCIAIPKGHRIGLTIGGKDYEWDGPPAFLSNIGKPMRGCGPFLHDDPDSRPADIFGGKTSLHFGPDWPAYLLLPIIPPN